MISWIPFSPSCRGCISPSDNSSEGCICCSNGMVTSSISNSSLTRTTVISIPSEIKESSPGLTRSSSESSISAARITSLTVEPASNSRVDISPSAETRTSICWVSVTLASHETRTRLSMIGMIIIKSLEWYNRISNNIQWEL